MLTHSTALCLLACWCPLVPVGAMFPPHLAGPCVPQQVAPTEFAPGWLPSHEMPLGFEGPLAPANEGLAVGTTEDGLERLPVPEVVLRFREGCRAAATDGWTLSSRDAPQSWTSVPLGTISIAVDPGLAPVEFVELWLNAEPLTPSEYVTTAPLEYEIPCPRPGRHVIQARYKFGNVWSDPSPALRIFIVAPPAPKIVGLADADQEPVAPSRRSFPQITTGSMRVRLANVRAGDQLAAYIDGKPVTVRDEESSNATDGAMVLAEQAEEASSKTCCRTIPLRGIVTPGVHTLTIRKIQCPESCAIASGNSNEMRFRYFEEDIYVLRPGAHCRNGVCPPQVIMSPTPAWVAPPSQSLSPEGAALQGSGNDGPFEQVRPGARERTETTDEQTPANSQPPADGSLRTSYRSDFHSATLRAPDTEVRTFFVSLVDGNATKEAAEYVNQTAGVLALINQAIQQIQHSTDIAAGQAAAAHRSAVAAENAAASAAASVRAAERQAAFIMASHNKTALLNPYLVNLHEDAEEAKTRARGALKRMREAASQANNLARDVRQHAINAQAEAALAATARDEVNQVLRRAGAALAQAQAFERQARLLEPINANNAEQARNNAAQELNRIRAFLSAVEGRVEPAAANARAAASEQQDAATDLAATSQAVQRTQAAETVFNSETGTAHQIEQLAAAIAPHLHNTKPATHHAPLPASAKPHDTAESFKLADEHAKVAAKSAEDAQGAITAFIDSATETKRALEVLSQERLDTQMLIDKACSEATAARDWAAKACQQRPHRPYEIMLRAAERNLDRCMIAHWLAAQAEVDYGALPTFPEGELEALLAQAAFHADCAADAAASAAEFARRAHEAHEFAVQSQHTIDQTDADLRQEIASKSLTQNHALLAGTTITELQARMQQALQFAHEHQLMALKFAQSAQEESKSAMLVVDDAKQKLETVKSAVAEAEESRAAVEEETNAIQAEAERIMKLFALSGKLDASWDLAELEEADRILAARILNAEETQEHVDVHRANDLADQAEDRAYRAEAKADARIRIAEANSRAALADTIDTPASPFYFASIAHFPIREFSPRGKLVEREGLIIYEDMKFTFDRHGNYEVKFEANRPNLPVTIKLQLQLQPYRGGPWYTITLAPIRFDVEEESACANGCQHPPSSILDAAPGGDRTPVPEPCCGKRRECICRGHSEILRRCYAELSQESRIRRTGTARFGFGVEVPKPIAAPPGTIRSTVSSN